MAKAHGPKGKGSFRESHRAKGLLGVIVPCFNEEKTVLKVLERVRAALKEFGGAEVVVVDDGSTDGTFKLLQRTPALFTSLLRHRSRQGKGACIVSALAVLHAKFVAIQDADTEYWPEDLPRVLEPLVEGRADVVYGRRPLGKDPLWRLLTADPAVLLYSLLVRALTGLPVTDMATCYKAFRKDILKGMRFRELGFAWDAEVTVLLGLKRMGIRFLEVPVRYNPRTWSEGKKLKLQDAFAFLRTILSTWLSRSFEGKV